MAEKIIGSGKFRPIHKFIVRAEDIVYSITHDAFQKNIKVWKDIDEYITDLTNFFYDDEKEMIVKKLKLTAKILGFARLRDESNKNIDIDYAQEKEIKFIKILEETVKIQKSYFERILKDIEDESKIEETLKYRMTALEDKIDKQKKSVRRHIKKLQKKLLKKIKFTINRLKILKKKNLLLEKDIKKLETLESLYANFKRKEEEKTELLKKYILKLQIKKTEEASDKDKETIEALKQIIHTYNQYAKLNFAEKREKELIEQIKSKQRNEINEIKLNIEQMKDILNEQIEQIKSMKEVVQAWAVDLVGISKIAKKMETEINTLRSLIKKESIKINPIINILTAEKGDIKKTDIMLQKLMIENKKREEIERELVA